MFAATCATITPASIAAGTCATTTAATAAVAANEVDAWKVGLGYTFGNTKLGGIYESIDHDFATSATSRDAWYINLAHKFGNNVFKAAYGEAGDGDSAASTGADHWTVGIDHNFSKRTTVYASYSEMNNDAGGTYGLITGDHIGTNGLGAGGAGADVDAFAVGIRHTF